MNELEGRLSEELKITWGMLRDAVAVYIEKAYPTGVIPGVVQKRTTWDEQRPLIEVLGSAPFENYRAKAPFPCTVYALRLGSADYPNLKMEIRPFPHSLGFVFWVNTHDEFVPANSSMRDSDPWRELVRRNRDLKQTVERAWADRQLPTFTSALREDMAESDRCHP